MEVKDIKIGELVVLKSGGPKMVVADTDGVYALCVWFDGNIKHEAPFKLGIIDKVE
jgi:uncharacterized protein YodC (DUF2158 family)